METNHRGNGNGDENEMYVDAESLMLFCLDNLIKI